MRIVTLGQWIVLILGLVAAGRVGARNLTPDEAMTRAAQYASGPSMSRSSAVELKLAYTARTASNGQEAAYYVFNRGNGGFVIASGDDRLRPVLAITDSGTFEADNLPPTLKWWLSQYEAEIAGYLATPQATMSSVATPTAPISRSSADNYAAWESIAPLVTTKWNQGTPYNNDCPVWNNERVVTGCVATAFAQIVNYHNYADLSKHSGETLSYTTRSLKLPVSYVLPEKFDFGNMLDEYIIRWENGESKVECNATQAAAVAELMKTCGVIVEMDYNLSRNGGSGAYTGDVPQAAIEYLGYDPTSFNLYRNGFQTPEWEKKVYTELSCGRPLIYSGQATGGGHAFVCDGYLYDGLFHINWGWGGMSDGYFALSTLNPSDQGIGSFEGGYNNGQMIVSLITPDDPEKPIIKEPEYEVELMDNPTYVNVKGYDNISIAWLLTSSPVQITDITAGLVLSDIEDNQISVLAQSEFTDIHYYSGRRHTLTPEFTGVTLAQGEYYIVCSFMIPGKKDWTPMKPTKGGVNKMLLVVDENGNRTFKDAEPPAPEFYPEVKLMDYSPSGELYIEDPISASIIVTNTGTGDFNGCIAGIYQNGSAEKIFLISQSVIIPSGQSFSFATTTQMSEMAPGGYTFSLGTIDEEKFWNGEVDKDNLKISDLEIIDGSFEVNIKPGSAPVANIPDVPVQVISASTMHRMYLPGQTISCPLTFYSKTGGSIKVASKLLSESGEQINNGYNYYNFTVGSGKTKSYTYDFIEIPDDLAPGKYEFVLCDLEIDSRWSIVSVTEISERVPITVGLSSEEISYYISLDGKSATAASLIDTEATEVLIPETIKQGENTFEVTALAEKLFANNKAIELIDIPASVSSIGLNAFSYTSNLKHIFFRGAESPLAHPEIAFYLTNPNLKIYVPGDSFENYAAFESVGEVYATITSLGVSESTVKLSEGESQQVSLVIAPNVNTDPEYDIEVTGSAATATLKQGVITIKAVKDGQSVITISSAQPGVESVKITVRVGENVVDPFDVNGDTEVNVSDVVSLVNLILNKNFDPVLHDLNNDKSVTVSDIVVLVNYILDGAGQKSEPSRSADAVEVPVSFDLAGSYTAMQTDLLVADGTRIEDVTLNPAIIRSHTLAYREIEPGRYRVMVYSPGNHAMNVEAGEPLFTLAVSGSDSVETEATMFVEAEVVPTGIDSIAAEAEIDSVIYFDLQGRRVSAEARGILIERTVYTDGTVVNRKISR